MVGLWAYRPCFRLGHGIVQIPACLFLCFESAEIDTCVVRGCYLDVTRVLQKCHKECHKGVLQECYKGATKVLQGCHKGVTRVLKSTSVDVCVCVFVFVSVCVCVCVIVCVFVCKS
jgi:hypothetical protein